MSLSNNLEFKEFVKGKLLDIENKIDVCLKRIGDLEKLNGKINSKDVFFEMKEHYFADLEDMKLKLSGKIYKWLSEYLCYDEDYYSKIVEIMDDYDDNKLMYINHHRQQYDENNGVVSYKIVCIEIMVMDAIKK